MPALIALAAVVLVIMKLSASIILLLVTLALGNPASVAGQPTRSSQEIAVLVSRLSWDSIGMNCDLLGDICTVSEEAKRLVRIGKPATETLLKVLEDENKGVAAHVILTQIWELPNAKGSMRFGEDKYLFTYNALKWTALFEESSFKFNIEKNSLVRNAAKWHRKVARYRNRHSVLLWRKTSTPSVIRLRYSADLSS